MNCSYWLVLAQGEPLFGVDLQLAFQVAPAVLVGVDGADIVRVSRSARMLGVRRMSKITRIVTDGRGYSRPSEPFLSTD